MKKFPTVSIITGTLNPDSGVFERVLKSIKDQDYRRIIEHVVLDGGSKKETITLARSYGCKVEVIHENELDGGARIFCYGINRIKGDLILLLPSDNILPTPDFLSQMIKPFGDKRVFATYPAYNTFTPDMDILTRYFALLGAPDPTLYYLKKSDKIPITQSYYDHGKILQDTRNYWIVKFDKTSLPTVGDNGYLVKKSVFCQITKLPTKVYIHLDAFMYFVEQGYNTYGVVKNSIIHVSRPNILDQVQRRVAVKQHFTDEKCGTREYLVMDWSSQRDRWNLFKYVIFSLTFIQPLLVSIRGYLKVRESAWFIHPVMCFLMVVAYGWSEIQFRVSRMIKRLNL